MTKYKMKVRRLAEAALDVAKFSSEDSKVEAVLLVAGAGSGGGALAVTGTTHQFPLSRTRRQRRASRRVFVENEASPALLRAVGFREVGVYHRHGTPEGAWKDVVIVERLLSPA